MKRFRSIAILMIILVGAGSAHAQLLDNAISNSLGAATEMGVAAQGPKSVEAITANLERQGYTNVAPSPSDPTGYTAIAPGGMPVAITVNQVTGQLVSAVPLQ